MFWAWLRNLILGGLIKQIADPLLQSQKMRLDAQNDAQRIEADKFISFWQRLAEMMAKAIEAGTERQKAKMNWWVFGIIIGVALFPGLFIFVMLALYNVFWHANGIWPQTWDIAAFPAPFDQWAQMSIEWIFDPVSLPVSVTTATVAGKVTGHR